MGANAVRLVGSALVIAGLMAIVDLRVNHAHDEALRRAMPTCPPGEPLVPAGAAAMLLLVGAALMANGFARRHRDDAPGPRPIGTPPWEERVVRACGGVEASCRALKLLASGTIGLVLWGMLGPAYDASGGHAERPRAQAPAMRGPSGVEDAGVARGAQDVQIRFDIRQVGCGPSLAAGLLFLAVPAVLIALPLIAMAEYERRHRRERPMHRRALSGPGMPARS